MKVDHFSHAALWNRVFRIFGLAAVILLLAGLLLSPSTATANPDHSAGDYFMFAKAAGDGSTSDRKANEPTCNSSNDKQADVSGSNSDFFGRLHSNADIEISGSNNTFHDTTSSNPEITFGTNGETCLGQNTGSGNTIAGGGPTDIDTVAFQVDPANGWPGNLGTFLNMDAMTFSNQNHSVSNLPNRRAIGIDCDVGTLTGTSDITLSSANDGQVVCNGTGLVKLDISGSQANPLVMSITIISHGPIEFSGQHLHLSPAQHGILAWTDQRFSDNATSIKLSGSNINVTSRAILFTPRSGQDISGSDDATLCIQMIGQGSLKVAGSNSTFGPLADGCAPAEVTPTLTLVKTVVNDNGGTATADDFQARINGNPVPWGVPQALSAGSYTASEDLASGYAPSAWGGDCATDGTITLSAGQDATCTITNNDIAPTLTLVKTVVNDNGGTATADNFQARINGNAVPWAAAQTLSAGNHTASEDLAPGYAASDWGGDCTANGTVSLGAGETKTCTITNDDIAPQLTVIKHVINDDGGTAVASNFTMNVAGTNVSQPSFPGAEAPGTTVTLNAGSYNVTETGPSGYEASFSANCSGTIAVGETKTCTVTNDDIAPPRGTIVIVKDATPADGTDFEFSEFNGRLDLFFLDDANPDDGDGVSNSQTFSNLVPGPYTVIEQLPAGWDLTGVTCDDDDSAGDLGQAAANIYLQPGETVICTFTNVKRGTATVIKTIQGQSITGSEAFTFQLRQGASTAADGTVLDTKVADSSNGGTIAFEVGGTTRLVPGDYQLCEFIMPGWDSTIRTTTGAFVPSSAADPETTDNSYVCIPFTLDAGEDEVFTIDNTPPPGGMAKTIGFWKNWSSCSGGNQDPVLDDTLASFPGGGVLIGDLFVDTCTEAVRILNKSKVNNGKKVANDAAYELAAQLLAAKLNVQAGAGSCSAANDAIANGQTLLDEINFTGTGDYLGPKAKGPAAQKRAQALALAETLDRYNNNLLCP